MPLERIPVFVRGRRVLVACAGSGSSVLLVHGGWAGADMHWSRIWARLADRHQVIAPDLPGLGAVAEPPLVSVADGASWLAELLDALSVQSAVCIGNSFGASVAWSLAGRFPDRCSGLVLVNGFPMPRTPPLLRRLGRLASARRLGCALLRRFVYTEEMIERAFEDRANLPEDLRRAMVEDWPRIIPNYVDLLVEGDGSPVPRLPPLLVWGAGDRLPGTGPGSAARWHQRLHGSTLRMISGAGHFPQVEAPDAFLRAVEPVLEASALLEAASAGPRGGARAT